jgi:hypothetical protein
MSKYELTLMSKPEKLLAWMADMGARISTRSVVHQGESREVVTVEAVIVDDTAILAGRPVSVHAWVRYGGEPDSHCFEALWDYVVADGLDDARPREKHLQVVPA